MSAENFINELKTWLLKCPYKTKASEVLEYIIDNRAKWRSVQAVEDDLLGKQLRNLISDSIRFGARPKSDKPPIEPLNIPSYLGGGNDYLFEDKINEIIARLAEKGI